MTTVQMHYFIVAAEHLNFTMAAEQLYITQPAREPADRGH